jgi:hypothetical protein
MRGTADLSARPIPARSNPAACRGEAALASSFAPHHWAVCLFGSDGTPERTLAMPFEQYVLGAAYNGRWIVLSRSKDGLLVDGRDGSIRRLVVEPAWGDMYWRPVLSPDGGELWLYEVESRTVHRFALPAGSGDRAEVGSAAR